MNVARAFSILALMVAPAWGMDLLGVSANNDAGVPASPVTSTIATSPAAPADSKTALDAFLKLYFDTDDRIIVKVEPAAPPAPPHNPWQWVTGELGRLKDWVVEEAKESIRLQKADYWWVPHFIQMLADDYELTGDARDLHLAKLLNNDLFGPFYYWWFNSFNDDLGWHMLACLRMHAVTHDARWLADGRKLYERIRKYLDGTYGGGVWWKRDGTRFKNVPINAPFVIGAMQLYKATGEAQFRQDAVSVYAWMEKTLFKSPRVADGMSDTSTRWADYTYNYGTFVGASLALYDETHEPRYLANATAAADWAIANLAPNGIVKDEGSGDGAGFKMIFTRYLVDLATRPGGEKYVEFLDRNAASAWANRRAKDSIMGYDWAKPAPGGGIQSFTAAAGVDIMLQSRLAHARPGR